MLRETEGLKEVKMKNKPRWYSILLIGLVLLLASSVIGCGQAYTKEDIDAAFQEGYAAGYDAGYDRGFAAGLAQKEPDEAPIPPDEIKPPTDTHPENCGALPWYEAKDHIGDRATVCGPVVGTHWASGSRGQPTFLNIGKPYPDPGRFTVVIWGENRANFPQPPEDYYLGKTVHVTGLITEYKGIPQIEVKTPDQIQIQ